MDVVSVGILGMEENLEKTLDSDPAISGLTWTRDRVRNCRIDSIPFGLLNTEGLYTKIKRAPEGVEPSFLELFILLFHCLSCSFLWSVTVFPRELATQHTTCALHLPDTISRLKFHASKGF